MEDIVKTLETRGSWFWLWEQLNRNDKENIRESILRLLTFFSIEWKNVDKIKRIGLNAIQLSSNNSLGTEKTTPEYKRVNRKVSRSKVYDILYEMEYFYLVRVVRESKTVFNGRSKFYCLTANGLIYSLCFLNENFERTQEILRDYLICQEHYPIKGALDSQTSLIQNFSKLSESEQRKYLLCFNSLMNEEGDIEKYNEFRKFTYLVVEPKLAFFYNFFMLPAIVSKDTEILTICKKIWSGQISIFQNNLANFIINHIMCYDSFVEKLGLQLSSNVNINYRGSNDSSGIMLLWIGRKANQFYFDFFGKTLGYKFDHLDAFYIPAMNYGLVKFKEIMQKNNEETREFLDFLLDRTKNS